MELRLIHTSAGRLMMHNEFSVDSTRGSDGRMAWIDRLGGNCYCREVVYFMPGALLAQPGVQERLGTLRKATEMNELNN